MIHVFLDSNVLFSDPFFQGNFKRNFIQAIKKIKGKVYVSDVVYREVINNYKKELKKRRKDVYEKITFLNKILNSKVENLYQDDEVYVSELIAFFANLEEEQLLEIIPHNKYDLFTKIVERALSNKKPFSDGKEEFKDTVIWLSYAHYVEKENLEHCFFISNNSKEFFNKEKSNLHPDLLEDTNRFKAYLTIEGIMTDIDNELTKQIQLFNQTERLKELAGSNNLNKGYIETVIREEFIDELNSEVAHYIESLPAYEKLIITVDGAEIEPIAILNVSLTNFNCEVFSEELIVYGTLEVINEIALYFFQPVIKETPQVIHFGNKSVQHIIEFSFTISSAEKVQNFEIKKIVTPIIHYQEIFDDEVDFEEDIMMVIKKVSRLNELLSLLFEDMESARRGTEETKIKKKIEDAIIEIRNQIRELRSFQKYLTSNLIQNLGSSVLKLIEFIDSETSSDVIKKQYIDLVGNLGIESELTIKLMIDWIENIYIQQLIQLD